MEDLSYWIGVLATILDANNLCTIMLSFVFRSILMIQIRYLVGLIVTFKVTHRVRTKFGRSSLATVLTIIVLSRFCLELVFWIR